MRYSTICIGVSLGIIQKIYSESLLNFNTISRLPQTFNFKRQLFIDEDSNEKATQKVKIFIFTRSEILASDDFGIYHMRRSSLERFQLEEIAQALTEFKELVRYASKGSIQLEFHVETDNAPLRVINQSQLLTQDVLENTLGTKFNHHFFDANDKIYRGPFKNIFVIHPLLNSDSILTEVNKTPTSVIGYYTHSLVDFKDGLVQKLFEQWSQSQSGELRKLIKERVGTLPFSSLDSGFFKSGSGDEGEIEEGGQYRKGFALVLDKAKCNSLFTKPGEKFSFDYFSELSNPYQVNFKGSKGLWSIGLGVPLKKDEVPFIDLSSLNQKVVAQPPEHIGVIEEVTVEPIKSARFFERLTSASTKLHFKNWNLCNESSTAFGESFSLLDTTQATLKNLSIKTEKDSQEIIESLNSKFDVIKINALKKVKEFKLSGGLGKAIEYLSYTNSLVAEAAAEAVASLDAKEGWEALLKQIDRGLFDHNRIAAIKQFLNKPYPGLELKISSLLTCSDWHGRYEAAKVLLSLKTLESERVLTVFLHETEPAIRFLIIKNIPLKSDFICKCLLWSAVNDVSEKVRNVSYLRLIQSSFTEYKEEALKSMRNESVEAKIGFLTQMESQPDEAFRKILQYAVIDENAKIRVAALRAFANLPGKVEKQEIENTFDDSDTEVKTALAELRAKKGI